MMRILFCMLLMTVFSTSAYCQTMADVLRTLPDTILPLLTKNDRLDLVDECQAGVKAEVRNRLGGMVELKELTDTKATLQTSSLSTVTLELVDLPEGKGKAVRRTHTCTVDGRTDSVEEVFTLNQDGK